MAIVIQQQAVARRGGDWRVYSCMIDRQVMVVFEHDRSKGLAQCLRDCADAYEANLEELKNLINK